MIGSRVSSSWVCARVHGQLWVTLSVTLSTSFEIGSLCARSSPIRSDWLACAATNVSFSLATQPVNDTSCPQGSKSKQSIYRNSSATLQGRVDHSVDIFPTHQWHRCFSCGGEEPSGDLPTDHIVGKKHAGVRSAPHFSSSSVGVLLPLISF